MKTGEHSTGVFSAENQFRLLIQSVTDYGIYMLDADGYVVTWNAGAQHIKGYTPEEIIGQHFSRFYTDEDRAAGEPSRTLETARREGRYEKEGWRVRKGGTRFWASIVVDPVRAPDGKVIGFAKVTRDITERRETQLQLERAREALFQSQKMEAIGQLTGGVAHDFNNLLAAIIGGLEIVSKRFDENDKARLLVDNAMQAALRGAALTQRMLAFARRQDLKPTLARIPEIVGGMTELLDRTLGPSFTIVTSYAGGLGQVMVDVNQFEMALLNLAVNARDAMPRGGSIRITAREEGLESDNVMLLTPGRYVRLSVHDSGHGMDEATLARATEPFFTTKGVGKGTGLGLSMVRGLAEQLGGGLTLESEVDKGTTASLWLPVSRQVVAARPIVEEKNAAAAPRLAILAVDDDAIVLFNTAAMLEDLGHTVTMAYSGKEALEALAKKPDIQLVITDQAMPRMTGAELIQKIRSDRPGLPILLATGYAELPPGVSVDVPKMSKPFGRSDLARAIAGIVPAGGSRFSD